jgi:hypothetical protein
VNGTNATTINGSGALSGFTFNFTSSDMGSNVSARGTLSYNGTATQAEAALQNAGFKHYWEDYGDFFHPNTDKYVAFDMRSPGGQGGAGGGHVVVHEPSVIAPFDAITRRPYVSIPTHGTLDLGTHNPYNGGAGAHADEVWNWLTK